MAKYDLLKVGNWKLQMKSNQRSIEFFVQEANLPGFTLGELVLSGVGGVQQERRPGDHIQWNNLTLSLICDEELEAYKEIMEYILLAKDPETGEMNNDEIWFDSVLHITTNKNNFSQKFRFYNCWISSVTDLAFNTTSSEDDPLVFNVEVIFSHFGIDSIEDKKAEYGIE